MNKELFCTVVLVLVIRPICTTNYTGDKVPSSIFPDQVSVVKQENRYNQRSFKKVIGFDERIPITKVTDQYPWSAIGQVRSLGCPGQEKLLFTCTGTMIASNVALTAAHCITRGREFCKMVLFTPGKSGKAVPFGQFMVKDFAVMNCFWLGMYECDIALLFLEKDVGCETGTMAFDPKCEIKVSSYLNAAGYPIDLDNGETLYFSTCDFDNVPSCKGTGSFTHQCDTASGMSGSPLWTWDPNTGIRQLQGINRSALTVNRNMATKIGSKTARWIQSYLLKSKSCQ